MYYFINVIIIFCRAKIFPFAIVFIVKKKIFFLFYIYIKHIHIIHIKNIFLDYQL